MAILSQKTRTLRLDSSSFSLSSVVIFYNLLNWQDMDKLLPLHSLLTLHSTDATAQLQYTLHKAWYLIKWQDLALHRHSAVIECIIFYILKKWKTILGPHQHSYKLPNPPTRATPNVYPLKLIYIYIYIFFFSSFYFINYY